MKKLGIVTSGGDAPGMNAAIRAIVRSAIPRGLEVIGFENGFAGLISNKIHPLSLRSVGGIIHLGGTILRTTRCPEFKSKKGVDNAVKTLSQNGIASLIVIGGGGSFRGAQELSKECDTAIIGVPATIDNDVFGTDETIGFDTAVNTAVSAIDKIRDTALSFNRVFVIEVMGRDRGFIALAVGLAAGAEKILVPEVETELDEVCEEIMESRERGKNYNIIVVAEGVGDTRKITQEIERNCKFETRLTTLGHIQRGGSPTARSRLLANLFGYKSVELLLEGETNKIIGLRDDRIVSESLEHSCKATKPLDMRLLRLAEELAL